MAVDNSFHVEIVRALSERLRACYIFPEVAERVCVRLQEGLDEGEYADITEGEFLALALTVHMQEASQDEHLWVRWHREPLPDCDGPLRHNQEWMDERWQEAQLDNYGLHRVERLPGNVGHVDIRRFHRAEWAGDQAAAAMTLVADTQALIFDLRHCLGGHPDMVALVSSFLFGEEPVHLDSIYWREDGVTQEYWTLPYVHGKRFVDKPVYLLISQETYSGGEAFAYNLKARGRATLVGETTGGGAHPGAAYRLHPHFEVFIPVGRAINPLTQENWQGRGVVPDIAVPQDQALVAAHRLALESVIESIAEGAPGPLGRLREEAQEALRDVDKDETAPG